MPRGSRLQSLPEEILLHVIQFLIVQDVVKLQSASKRFLRICRDNPHWRERCMDACALLEPVSLFRRGHDWIDEEGIPLSTDDAPHRHRSAVETIGMLGTRKRNREYSRIAANWDPTFPGEKANWYHEYIQRNGPIITNWFERPQTPKGPADDTIDVRGVALYTPSVLGNETFAVSPLDDGSVCIWDVKGSRSKKGSILSRSRPGLLWHARGMPSVEISTRSIDRGIVECVSVDNQRHAAFFALGNNLVEVDLQSLAIVTTTPFERVIMTMSAANPAVPLTIGTFNGLYLHDHRIRHEPREQERQIVQPVLLGGLDLSRIWEAWPPLPPYAALAQPGPQYIHHMDCPGHRGQLSDDIFVAGRFTSILHYDRRMFPSIKGSLHSGGRLCSLASLPYPFSSVDSDQRRRLELTEEQVTKSKNIAGGRTLIACGGYNTKGSLEMYGLSAKPEDGSWTHISYDSTTKNRQTASSSKLLSVVNHGNRIAFSDGQGYVKWMERDGFTEVRRHKIGKVEKVTHRSLFGAMPGSDDIARKLLSTRTEAGNNNPNDDDILFWTGETLGLLSFSSRPSFYPEDFVDSQRTPEEVAAGDEEQAYTERMRLVLERQADEARFVQNLGMPRH
ncbi:putative F-box domain-containing protein [Rosellinia necatrix]|uniref:Putative F-box domain-containing protein n=1 Tax=Rosellinia necatrix TaxID=77044 RepID=A0A1W2TJ19_ROSNE|nr:putative F-box domain-containing protein [Rosellinia necatrix]